MDLATKKSIVRQLVIDEESISDAKGRSYAGTDDVLGNFKRNAERLGMTPFQIWAVYFNKHIDSINNAIGANPSAPIDYSEGLEGRILDARTYLGLLLCLLKERHARTEPHSQRNTQKDKGIEG